MCYLFENFLHSNIKIKEKTSWSITDDSRFRVEFLNNNAPTGFFFDLDVTMQKNFKQVTHIEKFSKFYIQIKIFFDIMNKYLIL